MSQTKELCDTDPATAQLDVVDSGDDGGSGSEDDEDEADNVPKKRAASGGARPAAKKKKKAAWPDDGRLPKPGVCPPVEAAVELAKWKGDGYKDSNRPDGVRRRVTEDDVDKVQRWCANCPIGGHWRSSELCVHDSRDRDMIADFFSQL